MISVIITCFNEGELLLNAVDSLKNQSYSDFEVIIVKDFSEHDITNRICTDLESKGNKVLWSEKNIGPSGTRNLGIDKATGDIIIPLDADDTLPKNAVELIRNEFLNDPELDFVYGNYRVTDIEANVNYVYNCSVFTENPNKINLQYLLSNWKLLGMSPFRKSLWKKLNGYSMEFSFTCQDVDFQMRSLLMNARNKYICQVIYNWNKSNSGLNSSVKNRQDLDLCCYRNIGLLDRCNNNEDYLLYLCRTNNDMARYRLYLQKLSRKTNNRLALAGTKIFPARLLPILSKLILRKRKVKNDVAYS